MSNFVDEIKKAGKPKNLTIMEMGLTGIVCNEYVYYGNTVGREVLLKFKDGELEMLLTMEAAKESWLKAWQLRG